MCFWEKNLKKVLIITYHFPPKTTVASLRLLGLAKYLPEHGWKPIILTPAMPARSNSDFNVKLIETQYHDVLSSWKKRLGFHPAKDIQHQLGTVTSNNNSFNLINWFSTFSKKLICYPDGQKGWYPFATKAAEEFLQREGADAIISSSSPVTSHLIAKYLKTKFNTPWVADLRDLWTQNHYFSYNRVDQL